MTRYRYIKCYYAKPIDYEGLRTVTNKQINGLLANVTI